VISVPRSIWAQTVGHLRTCGNGKRECVVYLTGPAALPGVVDEAIHPKHLATAGYYEVADEWFHSFWVDLDKRHRSVRAQVHTHGGRAFHSGTDDEGAIVQIPGYLSLVLPKFAMPADCLDGAFLAQLDDRGRFIEVNIDDNLGFDEE
jgi:hypothetical protein